MEKIKCVVLGDSGVGKTSALVSFTTNQFPGAYVPTVFDNYEANVMVNGKAVGLVLWDTSGSADYDEMRPLAYPKTDVFVIMFSIVDKVSFENVKIKWVPEIKKHNPSAQYIVIGTKCDLRKNKEAIENNENMVAIREGEALAKYCHAFTYLECSALTQIGLKTAFDQVIHLGLDSQV